MADTIILPPNSKAIPLTQGKFAIVDDGDFEYINQWKWYFANGYAYRNKTISPGKRITIFMHRIIINTPNGRQTDHINGNGIDNRRSNLRICTHTQNMHNQGARKGSSKYKGVSWNKRDKSWKAEIRSNGNKIYVGFFKNEDDAARAYNKAAIKYHAEFAILNIIMPRDL